MARNLTKARGLIAELTSLARPAIFAFVAPPLLFWGVSNCQASELPPKRLPVLRTARCSPRTYARPSVSRLSCSNSRYRHLLRSLPGGPSSPLYRRRDGRRFRGAWPFTDSWAPCRFARRSFRCNRPGRILSHRCKLGNTHSAGIESSSHPSRIDGLNAPHRVGR